MITVNNIKPTVLSSRFMGSISGTFDPYNEVRNNIVKPLFNPLVPGKYSIEDNGNPLSEDDITQSLFSCSDDRVNVSEEQKMKQIFEKTLISYDNSLTVREIYAVQSGVAHKMPLPSQRVIYVETDVSDTAKELLCGQISAEEWFVTLAFYARISAFGFYFANETAWNDFKQYFATETAKLSALLSADTVKLCNDLKSIRLNCLTQSFVLRNTGQENNEPYSFARLFQYYLMQYAENIRLNNLPEYTAGHLPFSFSENICPTVAIIVNVEKHAHANPSQIKDEWNTIAASLTIRPKIMSLNKLTHLTAVTRNVKKMSALSNGAQTGTLGQAARMRFRKSRITPMNLFKYISRIYKHTAFVQRSENALKSYKMTYQKPSRRDPDNPDKQGKTICVRYKPDLHIYLDCSGSISEQNYQDAIKSCINLAKRMNINLYFNSFSHFMSQTRKLNTKGKSIPEIYKEFQKIPKVSGGTDYEQIWHYINRSHKLRNEMSIIITDFEYSAPNRYCEHPKHLYYAPVSVRDWQGLTRCAESFAKSALSICPDIRKHIMI